MEVVEVFTYTELRAKLAKALSRETMPPGTLSRWMAALGYPKGQPGRRRFWDEEDLAYLTGYGQAMALNYPEEDAQDYAKSQLLKFRERKNHACHR